MTGAKQKDGAGPHSVMRCCGYKMFKWVWGDRVINRKEIYWGLLNNGETACGSENPQSQISDQSHPQ